MKEGKAFLLQYLLCLELQIKMSKATKRKHVVKEVEDLSLPTETQSIVQILEARGNNLHEVISPSGDQYLVSMPMKFRRNIWVKRQDYVLVEPIPEGDKVKAEIVKILTREHQKWYRAQGCWPSEFDKNSTSDRKVGEEEDDKDLFVNTNRIDFCNRDGNTDDCSSSDDSDSN